jgi:hypothetical protein
VAFLVSVVSSISSSLEYTELYVNTIFKHLAYTSIDTKLNDRDKMFLLSLMSSVIKPQINSGLVLWCLTPRSTLFRAHLRARFELTFIVVIGTDCTGNCNPTTIRSRQRQINKMAICRLMTPPRYSQIRKFNFKQICFNEISCTLVN